MIQSTRRRRRGAVLIAVLACLMICASLTATALHQSLRSRRETKNSLRVRQTELLLQAGMRRATQQLQISSEYSGEHWDVSEALAEWDAANLQIECTRLEGLQADQDATETNDSLFEVSIVATLGNAELLDHQIQRSTTFTIRE
ncbi:hypothetical protein [Aureliella helgolandensis]|uniref:Uncharacterized protein n=1 Tax=Aureliella helgolandensis TaxID=2527968 RepID=A0A518G7J4_9BACT|nr:hypothetical protein [Aureliella helgolandensis]QDV24555.1 hypothetical protein Q31a_28750 [Aureliella helgolandensis]